MGASELVYSVPLLGLLVGGAFASTTTWVGGEGVWSDNSKWSDGAPVDNDTVQFDRSSSVTSNDIAGLSLQGVIISNTAGSVSLLGNGFTYVGDGRFTNESNASHTVSFSDPIVNLKSLGSTGGNLVFNSTLTSTGNSLTVSGGGTVVFNRPILGYTCPFYPRAKFGLTNRFQPPFPFGIPQPSLTQTPTFSASLSVPQAY